MAAQLPEQLRRRLQIYQHVNATKPVQQENKSEGQSLHIIKNNILGGLNTKATSALTRAALW